MILFVPEEPDGKIKFRENDIYVEEGVELNMHEWLIYEEFRKDLKAELTERTEE